MCTRLCTAESVPPGGSPTGGWRRRDARDAREVRERRNQRRHPAYERPELLATGPRELWSWDITKLRGPAEWTYFQLYVILDVFSRYVPAVTVLRVVPSEEVRAEGPGILDRTSCSSAVQDRCGERLRARRAPRQLAGARHRNPLPRPASRRAIEPSANVPVVASAAPASRGKTLTVDKLRDGRVATSTCSTGVRWHQNRSAGPPQPRRRDTVPLYSPLPFRSQSRGSPDRRGTLEEACSHSDAKRCNPVFAR